MGWMSWTKFYCEIDCEHNPFSCINEDLYKSMAKIIVSDGYKDAGYQYVHIDDCWMGNERDTNGRLVANKTRFPSGISALADYLHKIGLKFGIYEDFGTKTCEGYPGSYKHLKIDADTFAEWSVDYLKLDGCNIDVSLMKNGYTDMMQYLNNTGRSIVYSCSWPAYIENANDIDYFQVLKVCNLWRNYVDINRSWESIINIINYYNKNQDKLIPVHGPGHWNDPDMIIIGNTELTIDQSKSQMAIWSIWSAPLIMSNDLRTITPEYKKILLNSRAIAINQDPLGVMGRLIYSDNSTYVYIKKITPYDSVKNEYSYAVVIFNFSNYTIKFVTDLLSIQLKNLNGYILQDVWSGKNLGHYMPNSLYKVKLKPTSTAFFKAILSN